MLNSTNYFSHLFIITYSLLFLGQTFKAVWLDVHVLHTKFSFEKLWRSKTPKLKVTLRFSARRQLVFIDRQIFSN